eukprot:2582027-Rhodomonas_salina.3
MTPGPGRSDRYSHLQRFVTPQNFRAACHQLAAGKNVPDLCASAEVDRLERPAAAPHNSSVCHLGESSPELRGGQVEARPKNRLVVKGEL